MKNLTVVLVTIGILQFCSLCTVWRKFGMSARSSRQNGFGSPCTTVASWDARGGQLALVVPVGIGEGGRAMEAIARWPRTCSESTLKNVDLFLYFAEALTGHDQELDHVPQRASECFRSTKVISAHIAHEEEHADQSQRSAMFYKLFLDPGVSTQLAAYEAIAFMEWSMIVTHTDSFGRLYEVTFGDLEPFWVKGSTLSGTDFHGTAALPHMQLILGHINGNAVYNNSDPSFVEFVDYTRNRWDDTFPFDVALWATISDFPYSWPLWQRYASKFTVTNLMANMGSREISSRCIADAVSTDTLFMTGGTGVARDGQEFAHCTSACGDRRRFDGFSEVSTVCDNRCLMVEEDHPDGRGDCGAGDSSKFGEACRVCYKDREVALAAQRTLNANKATPSSALDGVIMCDTKRPPEAVDCSSDCASSPDAVCDPRCEQESDDRLGCNWRWLGSTCRHCFRDTFAAQVAETLANARGGQTIMCDTLEAPPLTSGKRAVPDISRHRSLSTPSLEDGGDENRQHFEEFAGMEFTEGVTRGQMCTFLPGYGVYLTETKVSVLSLFRFMPGMRVVISTHPDDFHEYQSTLGQMPPVTIFNSSGVSTSALMADRACGPDTRLIYYMSLGQVLSRTFTKKDTHTPGGDLLVTHTDVEEVDAEHARRSLTATALLGVQAPCFTYGSDLILPADANGHLRQVLLAAAGAVGRSNVPADDPEDLVDYFDLLQQFMISIDLFHDMKAIIDIPEMLAVLWYSRNPPGVTFVDPKRWSHDNVFSHSSIWDIPLLRPRFGCTIDFAIQSQGYNVAEELRKWVDAFHHGARCDRGFISVAPSDPVFI